MEWLETGTDSWVLAHDSGTFTIGDRDRAVEDLPEYGEGTTAGFPLYFRPADSAVDAFPSFERMGESVDNMIGYEIGLFRSPAEAKIAVALMLEAGHAMGDPDRLMVDAGYGERHEVDDDRSWWRRNHPGFRDGETSVYLGADEDPDGIVAILRPRNATVMFPQVILGRHGSPDSRPPQAAGRHTDIALVATLLKLVEESGHLRTPLTEADWRAWSADRRIPILPRTVDPGPPPGLRFMSFTQSVLMEKDPQAVMAANCFMADIENVEIPQIALEDVALEAAALLEQRYPEFAAVWADLRAGITRPRNAALNPGSVFMDQALALEAMALAWGADEARRRLDEALASSIPPPVLH